MDANKDRYDVVLLIEEQLSDKDAGVVRALHEGLDDQEVVYHVLVPMNDAAAAIEASMTAIGAGDMVVPSPNLNTDEIAALREECRTDAQTGVEASMRALTSAGATAGTATVVEESPIDALAAKVKEVDGREAIILTQPHLVAEFFHVDWTSKARRHIGVPVLHLLEHNPPE
ncbi:MAG: hypothetical protein FWD95_03940 [Nocardioidaceae bacterium]|nr:hypothetical protein [Nocardioidaceae bacterium]